MWRAASLPFFGQIIQSHRQKLAVTFLCIAIT